MRAGENPGMGTVVGKALEPLEAGSGDHPRARDVPMRAPSAARAIVGLLVVFAIGGVAIAQTSTSYKLTEFTFNNGGDPGNGSSAASASHRIRLDAIGDAVAATALSSASQHMDAGFVSDYPPSGEVKGHLCAGPRRLAADRDQVPLDID